MQVADVLWRRGSPSTQSQGSLSCCQGTSPAPPPKDTHVFLRYVQFHHGLNLLQEYVVFLQEDVVFLHESIDFLQEGRTFYRKLCVLQETSCRSFGWPEFILKGDLETMDWVGCMQASVGTLAQRCYLAPPSLSTCDQVPCTNKEDR